AKISASLTGRGLSHVDKLHWNPEVVIAGTVYGSRDNRRFLKQRSYDLQTSHWGARRSLPPKTKKK
nr:IS5/IS1182 family transposase [Nitrosomonas sp.]